MEEKLKANGMVTLRIHGLLKTHKEGMQLKTIFDTIGSLTYNSTNFIAKKLKTLIGNIYTQSKYSSSFIEKIKVMDIKEDDILLIFSAVSLFIMIPINKANKLVVEDLIELETTRLAGLCLKFTFLFFQGEYYEQTCGVAMG